ncbi:MAG: murein biosynthesis integral membrane protein MurJ [Bacillota bacterium]|nr:murein biosynthesis integral membrane protein MurJ [Bacillota bacterium]
MRTAAQTAMLMAVLTLGSKLLGFIREMIMAACFGASYITDAYVMANNIPGMIFGGIFGAVAVAYMPLFSKLTETKSREEGLLFTNQVMNLLILVSLVSSLTGLLLSDQIVSIFARGFTGETAALTSFYVKVSFSWVLFTSTASLLDAFLQYKGVFLLQVVTGYVQNAAVIAVILISYFTSHYYLIFGSLLGYAIRLLIVSGWSRKYGMRYRPVFAFGETVKKVFALSLPVFIGSYIGQINLFVDRMLASGLPEGSVSALNYGHLIMGLVTGLTTTIITTIIYPKMTQAYSLREEGRFGDMVNTGFHLLYIILVPSTLGLLLYSQEIVQAVYERGAFDLSATDMTGQALFFYAIGMLPAALNGLFVQTYYSRHNMKTPVIYGAAGVVINVALNLLLIRSMAHCGLALATSLAALCNSLLLYYGIRKKYPEVVIVGSMVKIGKITGAAVAAVACSYGVFRLIQATIWMPRAVALMAVVALAGLVYLGLLKLLQIEELTFVRQILKRRK